MYLFYMICYNCIGKTHNKIVDETFEEYSNMTVGYAFYHFCEKLFDELKTIEFPRLQRGCLWSIGPAVGVSLTEVLKKSIQCRKNSDDLFSLLCGDMGYICNWISIRILEKMSVGCSSAMGVIEQYKEEIYSRKLDVSDIPNLNIPADKSDCFTKIEETWNRDITGVAIKDFIKHWVDIEKLLNVKESLLLYNVTCNCELINIVWLLCNDLVERANNSVTTVNRDNHLLIEVLYLKIGDTLVKEELFGRL